MGKAQFFCPWTLCGCWRQPSCWNQTILFSPELPSWRKEEDNLFSLRLLMHSTYPNPNLAPALIFLLGCSTCGGSCLYIWLSKGWGVGCYSAGALLAQRLLQEGDACLGGGKTWDREPNSSPHSCCSWKYMRLLGQVDPVQAQPYMAWVKSPVVPHTYANTHSKWAAL